MLFRLLFSLVSRWTAHRFLYQSHPSISRPHRPGGRFTRLLLYRPDGRLSKLSKDLIVISTFRFTCVSWDSSSPSLSDSFLFPSSISHPHRSGGRFPGFLPHSPGGRLSKLSKDSIVISSFRFTCVSWHSSSVFSSSILFRCPTQGDDKSITNINRKIALRADVL